MAEVVHQQNIIRKAQDFAALAYHGEKRLNGEDWLTHVERVVDLLRQAGADDTTLAAAYLHDVASFGVASAEIETYVVKENELVGVGFFSVVIFLTVFSAVGYFICINFWTANYAGFARQLETLFESQFSRK